MASLTVIASDAEPIWPEPVSAASLAEQLRDLVTPVLVEDRIMVTAADPVGGGQPCTVADCLRTQQVRSFCRVHHDRWTQAGCPDRGQWDDPGPALGSEWAYLGALPTPLRWEIAYGIIQARKPPRDIHLSLNSLQGAVAGLASTGITSLLEPDEDRWPAPATPRHGRPTLTHAKLRSGFLKFTIDELDRLGGASGHEAEYARDTWRLRRLGVTGVPAGWILDFRGITQPWLRDIAKQFLRWRHTIGHSPSGMHRDLLMLTLLARALTEHAGIAAAPEQLDRAVINRMIALLNAQGNPANARRQRLSSIRRFLDIARQHNWIPGVPASAALYSEDLPKLTKLVPRALSPFVMAQLEAPANLAKLTDPRWRLLFPLLIETGLRLGDAMRLPQDCLVYDQQQAPYLRYLNRKMKREALVPISTDMAATIIEQRQRVTAQFSPKAALLPRQEMNRDGLHHISDYVTRQNFNKWINDCDVRDESGAPLRITPHQFRHTLGTRLINNDVPQEVVRKILDHDSSEMTAHYARLHDSTVREHWERARKIDVHGHDIQIAADSPLADAQWAKQNLARATMALPNGYCGLPLQQSCPHANACLTCPVFITTPEFLPQHREQLDMTRGIITRAQERGQLRLAEMNQRTADNLLTIITTLETPTPTTDQGPTDAS